MQFRTITLPYGARCRVPEHVQRIDSHSTHGWQLRYGTPTKFFSDVSHDNKGARAALAKAVLELRARVRKLPAPTGLQRKVSAHKQNDLPVGISGPILRQRRGSSVQECSFSVNLPRYGDKPLRRSVYIASKNTYSQERYEQALATAIQLRKEAEEEYQKAATTAKRKAVAKL
jgi:hypothetical protein